MIGLAAAKRLIPLSLVLLMTVLTVTARAESLATPAGNPTIPDSRKTFSAASPSWLRAIGKLHVPGKKYREGRLTHHTEDCSATLVAEKHHMEAEIIVTAWHCLEFYEDLSKPITFTLLPASGQPFKSEAQRLSDGGHIEEDWAILRLRRAVPIDRVNSLAIHPGRAEPDRPIMMAGYSRDMKKEHGGTVLSYDDHCQITFQGPGTSDSDCRAQKGASGGAVIQVSDQGEALLSGVISQGDGAHISTFIPVAGFRAALNRHLK